jgi:hypothetical protein
MAEDAAAPQAPVPPKYSRAIKGFILGVMATALIYPRVMQQTGLSAWGLLGGGGGGGHCSASGLTSQENPLCAATYYPPSNETRVTGRAKGCPPLPALCRLSDVFDEIVVLTLPRRVRQFSRFQRQMAALGENYTVVHGYDVKTVAFQSAWDKFVNKGNGYDTVGEFAVGLGWLTVLEHINDVQANHAIVFEDDVVFHSNFPEEFDKRIRMLPSDWAIFYLGSTQFELWDTNSVDWPAGIDVPDYYHPVYTWGAFAVGFNADMARRMFDTQRRLECRIDICTLPNELRRTREKHRNYAAYPHIAVADVRYSDLRAGADMAYFAKECRWNLAMFDLDNGYTGGGRRRRLRDGGVEGEGGGEDAAAADVEVEVVAGGPPLVLLEEETPDGW